MQSSLPSICTFESYNCIATTRSSKKSGFWTARENSVRFKDANKTCPKIWSGSCFFFLWNILGCPVFCYTVHNLILVEGITIFNCNGSHKKSYLHVRFWIIRFHFYNNLKLIVYEMQGFWNLFLLECIFGIEYISDWVYLELNMFQNECIWNGMYLRLSRVGIE